jgi:hypothetical protein
MIAMFYAIFFLKVSNAIVTLKEYQREAWLLWQLLSCTESIVFVILKSSRF